MDPHFYNVGKMSGQKENLERRQKFTRTLSPRNADSETNDPRNIAQNYYVETVKSKGEPDPMDYSNDTGSSQKKSQRLGSLWCG